MKSKQVNKLFVFGLVLTIFLTFFGAKMIVAHDLDPGGGGGGPYDWVDWDSAEGTYDYFAHLCNVDPDPNNWYWQYLKIDDAQAHGAYNEYYDLYEITSVSFEAWSNFGSLRTYYVRIKLDSQVLYSGTIDTPSGWETFEILCGEGFYSSATPTLYVRLWLSGFGEGTSHVDSFVQLP